ncbi:MAG: hypothetical protein ACK2UY_00465 [Anaerolineae bacterium]
MLATLPAALVALYLLAFFVYHSLPSDDPRWEAGAEAQPGPADIFLPGPLPWTLVIVGTVLGLSAGAAGLWQQRRESRAADTERHFWQHELIESLHQAASSERAFSGYTFLLAEFHGDPAMQAELRRTFRPDWLPHLRRQLGRHLRAWQFAEAEAFLAEMEWEWQESAGEPALAAIRALLGHLQQPPGHPGRETLVEILAGFRAIGLEAVDVILAWLAGSQPQPEAMQEVLFRTGGAGGRYLLHRWAERDSQVRRLIEDWEASNGAALRRPANSFPLWPRERGESPIVQRGVARLELDLNPFGPEKAEQDPLLPDLFYPLSPVWEEVTAPQPAIVVMPPGCGRSALLWMVRHESGLASTPLERVLPVYVPLHTLPSTAAFVRTLHHGLLDAWSCLLAHDPYGLLGLPEAEQQSIAEQLIRAAGGQAALLERLQGAGLPPGDPDGQLLQEVLSTAASAAGDGRGTGVHAPLAGHGVDLATVSHLVRDAFTPGELRRFCQERPAFRPFLDRIGEASLNELTYGLVEYCEKGDLFTELLAEIAAVNPRQYRRHRAELGLGATIHTAATPEIPHGWLTQPYGVSHTFLLLDTSCQNRDAVALLAHLLFERWLPWLGPRHFVPKLFVESEPEGCPLPAFHVGWDREALHGLLRYRLERAGLVVHRLQPALQGWVEGVADPDAALVEAARQSPAKLIRLGNRLIRRLGEPQALSRDEFFDSILEKNREDRPTL